MKATIFGNRAFERTLRNPPFAGPADDNSDQPSRQFFYLRLMQVSIRHNYYNRSHHKCPDFTIFPTTSSAALMQNLGLLFKDEGTGFSILYDVRREEILIQYLKRQEWPKDSKHCWTRLSFVLSLNNPYFLNFTEIPINLNPVNQNFYFTNQRARRRTSGRVILNPGPEQELLTVVPVQFGVDVDRLVKEVEVQDIAQVYEQSREAVICRPRCIPVRLLNEGRGRNPANITCEEAKECKGPDEPKKPGDPKCNCTNKVYLDFSAVPEDKYTIKKVQYATTVPPTPTDQAVLYTESYPTPLCFMDLFFTSPAGKKPSLFPVRSLFEDAKIEPVSYELKFERRSTYWNYFIVPRTGETLENLRIETEAEVTFSGPCCVYLPNGTQAYRFVSKEPLPLIQQSPFHFRLTGEIGLTPQNKVLMSRLPVPSVEQVLQDELTACLSLDESICPDTEIECQELKEQICGCVCAGSRIDPCLKVLKRICRDPQSPECRERRLGCSKIYSDTYVYV